MAKRAAEATEYSPDIEARRADYEKLTEGFIHMFVLEMQRAPSLLDIEGPDGGVNGPHLIKAINDHLYALHMHVDWYNPDTLRKFYVEMRLWGDMLEEQRKQASKEVER